MLKRLGHRCLQGSLGLARRLPPQAAYDALARLLCRAGMGSAGDANQAPRRPEHVLVLQLALVTGVLAVSLALSPFWLATAAGQGAAVTLAASALAFWLPLHTLRERARRRQARILRDLPFVLDMTTLCVEAGQNLQGALQQAAQHGPDGPLREALRHALADIRAGVPRARALAAMAERSGVAALASLVVLITQAEQMGMSLGPLLRAQAQQRRAERFVSAEKLALEAPVKMLVPLVVCLFPCTFLIIAFPIGYRLLDAGF